MPYFMIKGFLFEVEDCFDRLMDYQVIFLGEEHECRVSHRAELAVLKGLAKRDPHLVLSLEMFERDVQPFLDYYLEGEISEKAFLERSRPWPNYRRDYRPLVSFARRNRIPVVAANLPRRAAAAVAMANRITPGVLKEDRKFLPEKVHLQSKRYYKRFVSFVASMPLFTPMRSLNVDGLYKAQVLKDAVMAASLEPFLCRRILFCCGHFHSDYHLGIPYQLQKNHPDLRIAVIAMAPSVENLPMEERIRVADFIWVDEE